MIRKCRIILVIILIATTYTEIALSDNIDELFTAVVYLSGGCIKEIDIDNKKYELWIKAPKTNNYIPLINTVTGSGFFVQDSTGMYLVTAEHVARSLVCDVKVIVHGKGDVPLEFNISQLIGNTDNINWVFNQEADVAVVKLKPIINLREHTKTIPVDLLVKDYQSLDKYRPLTIIGFPLSLGLHGKFSPIIKTSKTASGYFRHKRFDNDMESNFFILEDASAAGFSGAPVFALPDVKFGGVTLGVGSFQCMGLVHGTISDNTGGKFAAIVPSIYILNTIEQAHNISK